MGKLCSVRALLSTWKDGGEQTVNGSISKLLHFTNADLNLIFQHC